MDKLQQLKQGKAFLRKVTNYRRILQSKGKSYLSSDYCNKEIANIEYALPRITSLDALHKYLERKENTIRYLIPSNKTKWFDELRHLRHLQLN